MVRLLTAGGVMQDHIAKAIGISAPTLRRHYSREIMIGQTEIDALAIATLVAAMRGGGMEAVIAAKFWTQCRMGWGEGTTVADDGKPVETVRIIVELVGGAVAPDVGAGGASRAHACADEKNSAARGPPPGPWATTDVVSFAFT